MRRDRVIRGTDLIAAPVALGTAAAGASYGVPAAFRLLDDLTHVDERRFTGEDFMF